MPISNRIIMIFRSIHAPCDHVTTPPANRTFTVFSQARKITYADIHIASGVLSQKKGERKCLRLRSEWKVTQVRMER